MNYGIILKEFEMSIISIACTKEGVAIVHTSKEKSNFSILFHERLAFMSNNWNGLVQSIESVLKSRINTKEPKHFVIVKAATGQYAASPDTYKAEGFVEYVLFKMGLKFQHIAKQSLPKAVGCQKGEKWQDKAKKLFDGNNQIKGFKNGFDAACAGAFSKAI